MVKELDQVHVVKRKRGRPPGKGKRQKRAKAVPELSDSDEISLVKSDHQVAENGTNSSHETNKARQGKRQHKEKWRNAIRKSGMKSEIYKLSIEVKTWKPVSPIKEERCS